MKDSTLRKIVQYLNQLEDDFYGEISFRIRDGDAVLITKEETVKLDDEKHGIDVRLRK